MNFNKKNKTVKTKNKKKQIKIKTKNRTRTRTRKIRKTRKKMRGRGLRSTNQTFRRNKERQNEFNNREKLPTIDEDPYITELHKTLLNQTLLNLSTEETKETKKTKKQKKKRA
jgi:hypothetical protein